VNIGSVYTLKSGSRKQEVNIVKIKNKLLTKRKLTSVAKKEGNYLSSSIFSRKKSKATS